MQIDTTTEPLQQDAGEPADTLNGMPIERLSIQTIRTLAIDAVQAANSGHPGAPMALAPVAYLLSRQMRYNPRNPDWFDRDRFVLSAGHASMLLYAMLHLTGYDLPLEELKRFRQLGSKTPGHPEVGLTPGVETTTGPLGQGLMNAVGMAMAEAHLAAVFNRPGHRVIDHFTYVVCSDGDLMEGASHEGASLAGHLGLGKLIMLYDDNRITIDGSTDLAWSDDVSARFGVDLHTAGHANTEAALLGIAEGDRLLTGVDRERGVDPPHVFVGVELETPLIPANNLAIGRRPVVACGNNRSRPGLERCELAMHNPAIPCVLVPVTDAVHVAMSKP